MAQLGSNLKQIIYQMWTNFDPSQPFMYSKVDIKDGFWRLMVSSENAWHSCYVLPPSQHMQPSCQYTYNMQKQYFLAFLPYSTIHGNWTIKMEFNQFNWIYLNPKPGNSWSYSLLVSRYIYIALSSHLLSKTPNCCNQ